MSQGIALGFGSSSSPTIYRAGMMDVPPIGFILDPGCNQGPTTRRMSPAGTALTYYSQYVPCTGGQRCQQTYLSPCSQQTVKNSTCSTSNSSGIQYYDVAYAVQ